MKRTVSGVILTLLLVGLLTSALHFQPVKAAPTTITVPDDYPTIQAAINAASDGGTVFVNNGTYYENVVVNKTVALVGENRESTIVDSNFTGIAFNVTSNDVRISGFTVRNGYYYGIRLSSVSNCTTTDNVISYNYYGIDLRDSSYNTIVDNVISYSTEDGILITAESNWIENNSIINNTNGIMVSNSLGNVISGNDISENTFINLYLWHSWNTTVSNNTLTGSEDGIFQHAGSYDTIFANDISNAHFGIYVEDPWGESRIFHNNFVNNFKSAQISSHNAIWDNGYPFGGNYWSNYNGTDLYQGPHQNVTGSDGKGDTPYVIDANNTDHYPLMRPYLALFGDLNIDGRVDMKDIAVVAAAFGSSPGNPRWYLGADINQDGIIDMRDVGLVARHFGQHYP